MFVHRYCERKNDYVFLSEPSYISRLAGFPARLPTWLPLGRTQRREQTRTPRQDFLRMLTLWLLVFRIAQPLECRRASSQPAGKMWRQWPSAHSGHAEKPPEI